MATDSATSLCYRRNAVNLPRGRRFRVQHRRCMRGVRSNRYRLCSGALPTGDSSRLRWLCTGSAPRLCSPPGISIVKQPLTPLTARVSAIP
jgi:hypothetical protein